MITLYSHDFRNYQGNAALLAWIREHGVDPAYVRRCEADDHEIHLEIYDADENGRRFLRDGDVASHREVVPLRIPLPSLP